MSMFDVTRVSVEVGGEEISFETGKLARQASGAVVVRSGDTMVLNTATAGNDRDVDFLPLTVDVEEKHYAAGKIPGSFFRREARAGEKATLTARMIDRPIRPLFPKGWHRETQLVSQPMSVDHVHPYDILAMNGASAALAVSDIPVAKHVGAVRIGKLDGDFVVNPEEERLEDLDMDLIVSGTDEAILMVEAGADGVTEAEILDALDIAHGEIKKLVATMQELREKAGKEKIEIEPPQVDEATLESIKSSHGAKLDEATQVQAKLERQDAIDAVEEEVLEQYAPPTEDEQPDRERLAEVKAAFAKLEKDTIRRRIAVDKKRPDGRAQDEIRPIETEIDIAPRVHGSALFTRGETQILSSVALGTTRMDMKVDNLGLQETKRFWHHYNFPPFSVGEAGFMRGPKRRDIGHGALAERALEATIPSEEDFPYVIRVVSDTLESNGSSSMGSVCASSMALQAAGVPVSAPVAGVAMGLIKEGDDYTVLTDIAGVEDHLGDMDFKVAGTAEGITALQMDIKITGVTLEILKDALDQAHKGRQFILGKMAESIDHPREQLSQFAPKITSIKIDPEKIGALIGKGGETIRGLSEEFEAEIDVDDDGTVRLYAPTGELVDALAERITSMTKDVEVGDRFKGKVVKTTNFGAFVELTKGTDGLLHISNVKPGERVGTVEDVLNQGDEIDVTAVEVDKERGRIGLRLSADPDVEGKSAEELAGVGTGDPGPPRGGRRDGGGGGGRRRERDGGGRRRERDGGRGR
ncbi:MAG TPA: polyribonucleotide nucleotidyltransferase [Solirubrobacterales bacterium]|jgi:polyribonucleotide nucleotidyltransferase|nr:polyribonucleotide nucleotidyltransferase [Solirubrobacterales bacterium]